MRAIANGAAGDSKFAGPEHDRDSAHRLLRHIVPTITMGLHGPFERPFEWPFHCQTPPVAVGSAALLTATPEGRGVVRDPL